MTDMVSLVMLLAPDKPVTTPGHLGRAVHNFWFDLVTAHDQTLSTTWHDKSALKPFTCSTLVGGTRKGRDSRLFTPENPGWVRITALASPFTDILLRLNDNPPSTISLDNTLFEVKSVATTPAQHPWANTSTYSEMLATFVKPTAVFPYQASLEFVSPTGFSDTRKKDNKRRIWPVPMPHWVFDGLLERWQRFSFCPFRDKDKDIFSAFIHESLVLGQYNLETRAIPLHGKIPQMGCTGQATYKLVDKDPYWPRILHLLTHYAFYAGVGYQTTAGMGQARPLASPEKSPS